jgi:hypothetical protein
MALFVVPVATSVVRWLEERRKRKELKEQLERLDAFINHIRYVPRSFPVPEESARPPGLDELRERIRSRSQRDNRWRRLLFWK